MNSQRAEELEAALRGESVGNWAIRELIDHGKSAAVFVAECEGSECALKIFDTDIVERYGRLTQKRRIEREVSLSDHNHPNLIRIYEGGECPHTGHLYIAMQRISAPTLATLIPNLRRERIRTIIREIAGAARYLEEQNIAHRDIKPDNIVVSEETATLLDLGVLRAISHPGGTDNGEEKPFVGTLQYSPPEFLLREEEDSLEGWRAVTFYQLGAVLHDMIERKAIFSNFAAPYAQMVNAVQHETPQFSADDVPTDLIHLARRCLLKDPAVRQELVSWADFENDPPAETKAENARKALIFRQREMVIQKPPPDAGVELRVALEEIAPQIRNIIRNNLIGENALPPVTIHDIRQHANDARFTVVFAPSSPIALEVNFVIEFMLELVDAAEGAFRLKGTAWITADEVDPSLSREGHIEVYAGVVEPEELAQAVQGFVLPALVDALNAQARAEDGEVRIISTEVDLRSAET